jgi:hypothetical protein
VRASGWIGCAGYARQGIMSGASRRLRPTGVVLTAFLASCRADTVPRLRFPQVEQATEAVQGGGERYRDHRTCTQSSTSVQDLVDCMDRAHWHFVPQGAVFPEPECWEARKSGELERVSPHCFVRAPEHP